MLPSGFYGLNCSCILQRLFEKLLYEGKDRGGILKKHGIVVPSLHSGPTAIGNLSNDVSHFRVGK